VAIGLVPAGHRCDKQPGWEPGSIVPPPHTDADAHAHDCARTHSPLTSNDLRSRAERVAAGGSSPRSFRATIVRFGPLHRAIMATMGRSSSKNHAGSRTFVKRLATATLLAAGFALAHSVMLMPTSAAPASPLHLATQSCGDGARRVLCFQCRGLLYEER
jgi:hypothetical protein